MAKVITIIITLLTSLFLSAQITTVFPKNNSYLPYSNVNFSWNIVPNSINYSLIIANDIEFNDIIEHIDGIVDTEININLSIPKKYHWKVRFYDGLTYSDWSKVSFFEIYTPESLSNHCIFRLNADSVFHNSNVIDTLYNYANNSYFAFQSITSAKPILIDNAINGRPTVRFDGNDYLNGDGLVGNITKYSFFTVLNSTEFTNFKWIYQNSPFGFNSSFSISCASGSKFRFWPQGGTGTGTVDFSTLGSTSNFYQLSVITNNDLSIEKTKLYNDGFLDGTTNTNTLTHNDIGYKIGVYNSGTNFFKGDIAEIILFDTVLNTHQKFLIENHFRYKFFPSKYIEHVDLGYDIHINESFCDTIINAYKNYYTSYIWNTGETDSVIHINKSGIYSVTVTDIYGFQYFDSIQVHYPNVFKLTNTVICQNDTIEWNTGMTNSFNFNWLNSSETDSVLNIWEANEYSVTITDLNGCSFYSDTIIISIDDLNISNSLGFDRYVCTGEPISITNYLGTIESYFWNTGENTPTININASGNYSITVTSQNNCESIDSVFFDINGVAPTMNFTYDTVCLGNSTSFLDLSSVSLPDEIISWSWNFGNGNFSSNKETQFNFSDTGVYSVELFVETSLGCFNSISNNIYIKNNPTADFEVIYGNSQCINQNINFKNKSIPFSEIINFKWSYDEIIFSTEENPIDSFNEFGDYNVKLTIEDLNGCKDSSNTFLKINSSLPIPSNFSLITPTNNYIFFEANLIHFEWNTSSNSTYYQFELFKDNINTLIHSEYTANNSISFPLNDLGKYYWRVTAFNNCFQQTMSNIYTFNLSEIDMTSIVRWFDANHNLILQDDFITSWFDKKDGIIYSQSDISKSPKIDTLELLNNKKVAKFDGLNDDFIINNQTTVGSVITLFNYDSQIEIFSEFKGIINSSSLETKSYVLLTQKNSNLIYTGGSNTFGSNIYINTNLNLNLSPLKSYKILYGFTQTPHIFNNLQIGGAVNNSSNYWQGSIAEIIVFNSELNFSELQNVYNYLKHKYTPPINLGADIYKDYGFCDTTISAYKPWFTSYLWNTNETDSIISVDSSGFYSVTVTDIFGFTSFDSLYVQFSGNISEYNNSLFCSNDSILINTNLSHDGYTFLWSNNLTDSAIYVKNGELLSLTITDSLGCFRSQTIEIFEDTLARINIFPNSDTSLCSNNFLTPELNAFSPLDFFWSTSQTTSSIIINNSDNYSVTVTNENGCQAIDTIFVHVVGEAPTPLFSADTVCLGFPTTFTDQSFSTDLSNINYWHWDFGDGSSDVTQHPQHLYDNFGIFDVTLTLETDSGCGNKISKKVLVNRIPEFDFNISYSQPCSGENYPISFSGEDHLNTISEWQWTFENANAANFDDNSDSDVAHIYQNAGTYFSRLVVWDDNGCTDTTFKKLVIYPTPQPDFVYTPDCEGKTSAFTDNTPNAATNWNWQWNATGISGNIGSTPIFSYNFLNGGGYNVTMTVQTPQQCVAQTVKNIFIPKRPNVQYSITDFCINTPIQVFDESTVLNSYPVKWHWNVLNHPNESSEQHPNFTFPEQNNLNKYSLRLVVESVEGCKDSTTKTITVHKEPTADFTFNPKFGQPPLAVNFSNQSSEDVIAYHWSFGDNQFSELENPVHLYIDSAVYDIQLKVNNEFGCADSTTKFIKVLLPTLDLAIANAKSSLVNDRYLTITANIINLGTRAVFDFNLFLVSSDNVVIREVWEGELLTNQVIPYQFTASFDTEQQTTPKYICVKVDHPNGEQDENMSNNEYCLTFSDFTVFDPYPNPTFETLNLLIIIPKNSNIEIKLLNQIGQEVRNLYSGQLNKGIQKFDYDISTLRNGIYTLKFSNGEEVILKTFIKQ
jgi:PKD repeat protein